MTNEIELKPYEEKPTDLQSVPIPINFLQVGDVRSDDVRIYIRSAEIERIDQFAAQDLTRERGGVLVGKYSESSGKRYVIIEGILEAKNTDSSSTSVTFTHATWDTIHTEKASQYPNSLILGWFHTHPRFGIFLSSYDMFIQQNYFNLPWQIAYVVDPVAKTRGFFIWRSGQVVQSDGYFLYDDPGKIIIPRGKLLSGEPNKNNQDRIPENSNKSSIAKIAGSILAVVLLISIGILSWRLVSADRQINDLKKTSLILSSNIIDLQGSQGAVNEDFSQMIDNIDQLEDEINKLKDKPEPTSTPTTEQVIEPTTETTHVLKEAYTILPHRVEQNETLQGICDQYGIPKSMIDFIVRINGLNSADEIYADQTIYIPVRNDPNAG